MPFYRKAITSLLGLLLLSSPLAYAGLNIENPILSSTETPPVLEPGVVVELAPEVIEALLHAVPITFEWQVELLEQDNLLWSDRLWRQQGRWQIQYRPLSQRYVVSDPAQESETNYATLDRALEHLQNIQIELPGLSDALSDAKKPAFRLRVMLVNGELPPPLRLPAFLSEAWTLDSGWVKWRLAAIDAEST